MEINELLAFNKKHLRRYRRKFNKIKFKKHDVLVFDIEACAIKNHTEMLTYSIACISCFDNTAPCINNEDIVWTNNVKKLHKIVGE